MTNILITGSAGYIGSICTQRLLEEGFDVIGFDNLSTGYIETIEKLKKFNNFKFIKGDLKNFEDIKKAFENEISAVFHFAGYSQVAQSQKEPLKYYENNVCGAINLFKAMELFNVKKIVFSSTASIYGNPIKIPLDENHPKNPINTYGRTKLIIENILSDLDNTQGVKSAKLRYFNACGASDNLEFGEGHNPETHLIPNILKNQNLKVYGNNYNTPDGTCIRDYIDVEDLVDAHILALEYLNKENRSIELNLGTKKGYSVKEIIDIAQNLTNQNIKYEICPRREGDPEKLIADSSKAQKILNWKPKRTIEKSIEKAFRFTK